MAEFQRLQALHRANDVRERRAVLRRDLAAGRCEIADVIADPPSWVRTMPVAQLLMQGRWMGQVKVAKLLRDAGMSGVRPVGDLTPRQCRRLAAMLRGDDA